ncbi:hypothetical protein JW879_03230 [candidate division WOR-3 bacterium]|nr:hypothetical protein [candidate division WOR-3 bacterium]
MKFLKTFSLLYITLTLILLIQLLSQDQPPDFGAMNDATKDANKKVCKACWFGTGLTIVGAGIAFIWSAPSPDPAVFVGKPPEYVEAYTYHYKRTAKNTRIVYSMSGCIFSVVLVGGAILIPIAFETTYDCISPDPSSSCFEDFN